MVRKYGKGDRLYVQAQQIWLILSAHAVFRIKSHAAELEEGLLTYGDLAKLMGKPQAARTLGRQLGVVGDYCVKWKLPALNVIVVNQESGKPGEEVVVTHGKTVAEDQRDVLNFRWFEYGPPSIESLKEIYDDKESGTA